MPKRGYWLLKSEPSVYGIDDLARDRKTCWDGVRNYQARNSLRDDMQRGDLVLFYHSSSDPTGVAGVARVAKTGYPDPTQFDAKDHHHDPDSSPDDPRWYAVDVEMVEKLPRFVTLEALKAERALAGMKVIQRGMRLSVQPVDEKHFRRVLALGGSRRAPGPREKRTALKT